MLSDSRTASMSMFVDRMSEPDVASAPGIYIGRTPIYRLPFMLDASQMLNPHISVIGTSGSGKTYLLKAIVARSALHLRCNVLILDWTGEYSKLVRLLDGYELIVGNGFDIAALDVGRLLKGVASMNLSALRQDDTKAAFTKRIIDGIAGQMHRHGIDDEARHMIVLDEAWRFLSEGSGLGTLFREGRKYGFGVILATQLVADIRNEAIANSATIALFKLQNSDDISILESSGIIKRDDAVALAKLGQGSCLFHLSFKDNPGQSSNVVVSKVVGTEIDFYELRGSGMRISEKKFRERTGRLGVDEGAKARIYGFIDASDRCIDEIALVRLLLELELKRPRIVTYLRSLGLDDVSIVAAYEAATTDGKDKDF